jgi:hypothetical protein
MDTGSHGVRAIQSFGSCMDNSPLLYQANQEDWLGSHSDLQAFSPEDEPDDMLLLGPWKQDNPGSGC